MNKNQKRELIDMILQSCLFSEYLPIEFNTNLLTKRCFEYKIPTYSIPPIEFSMDKFNDYGNRRFISIPEISTYIDAVHSLYQDDVLDKIIRKNNRNTHTLSKILNEKKEITHFSDGYGFSIDTTQNIENIEATKNFQNNLKIKIAKSKGCDCILHLDINSFYNSIYTHNITTLINGEDWATNQYQKSPAEQDDEYKHLKNVDTKIASMNLKRTHGLLTGPRLSFIIAESLLTQIDFELIPQLKTRDVDFVRYVDDYDVFVKNKHSINDIVLIFNQTLQKYGLLLNDAKTKIEYFPYYVYTDFNSYSSEKEDIINIYAKFAEIEKAGTQNGAILYFCQNILSQYDSNDIALSLSFSILKNVSKALMSSCKNIANTTIDTHNELEIYGLLIKMLKHYAKNKMDLECIWILYTLLKLFPTYSIEEDSLLYELGEVCLVIYLYEAQHAKTEKFLIERAKDCGWLLNYELFFNDIISSKQIADNLKIKDISFFEQLKKCKINFYNKK